MTTPTTPTEPQTIEALAALSPDDIRTLTELRLRLKQQFGELATRYYEQMETEDGVSGREQFLYGTFEQLVRFLSDADDLLSYLPVAK